MKNIDKWISILLSLKEHGEAGVETEAECNKVCNILYEIEIEFRRWKNKDKPGYTIIAEIK